MAANSTIQTYTDQKAPEQQTYDPIVPTESFPTIEDYIVYLSFTDRCEETTANAQPAEGCSSASERHDFCAAESDIED
jgi:hypothetical protein